MAIWAEGIEVRQQAVLTGVPYRHCERNEAIHLIAKKVWIASSRSLSSGAHSRDPLAPRNDGETQLRDLAARGAQVVFEFFAQKTEGVGNAGCQAHPQPRVRMG
jgi:hypothetical protein